jgi:hypothetical protein
MRENLAFGEVWGFSGRLVEVTLRPYLLTGLGGAEGPCSW